MRPDASATSGVSGPLDGPARPRWDNTRRLQRFIYRMQPYLRFTSDALRRGVAVGDVARTQFPWVLPSATKPPLISLELTNACNLRCGYCWTMQRPRPLGVMSEATFGRVIENVERFGVQRVKLIGGEPTMHPKFPDFVRRLGRSVAYLQLVTNAQWRDDGVAQAVVEAVDLIEVSIDAGGREQFEASRQGASYDRLMANLRRLAELKQARKTRSTLNVRLMVRPSNMAQAKGEIAFYRQWADTVMRQNLTNAQSGTVQDDVFVAAHTADATFPRCTLPFKNLEIKWNGDMPLCGPNSAVAPARRIGLGNLASTSIHEAWNSPILQGYRRAQRRRDQAAMPACRGCQGI